jgi:hypothetical protein
MDGWREWREVELDLTGVAGAEVAVGPPPLGEGKEAALQKSAVEVWDEVDRWAKAAFSETDSHNSKQEITKSAPEEYTQEATTSSDTNETATTTLRLVSSNHTNGNQTYSTHTTHEGTRLLFLFLSDGLLHVSLSLPSSLTESVSAGVVLSPLFLLLGSHLLTL